MILHSSRTSFFLDILREISVNVMENEKRKDHDSSVVEPASKKRAVMISNAMLEKLKKENNQLKREIQRFKDHWMRKFFFSNSRLEMSAFRSTNWTCRQLFH